MNALAWTLIHFIWEGAAIALVLSALLRLSRSARVRYGLACAAMLAMLAAFGLTLIRLWPQPAPAIQRHVPAAVTVATGPLSPVLPPHAGDRLWWLAPAWMVGVFLFSVRSLVSWLAARRLRRTGIIPATELWQEKLREIQQRMGISRVVALFESCLTDVPVLVGSLRPVILLPVGLLAGFPPEQIEYFLIHELAHVRRWDYLVNVLQNLMEDALFFHPAVWWVSALVRAERENCCDDVAAGLGNAHGLAEALAALEQSRLGAPEPALAANGGQLMKRIQRLLGEPEAPRSAAGPVLIAAILLASAAAAVMAQAPQPATRNRAAIESPYQKWLNEDVAYIVTNEERQAFRALTTDAERQRFIEQFWQRRDPTPGTPENEYRVEHYRRIAYTNDNFAFGDVPGWKTDRGAIYIRYGPPDELERDPGSATVFPRERWLYHFIQGIGTDVNMEFVDSARIGEFHMTLDPSAGPPPTAAPVPQPRNPAPPPAARAVPAPAPAPAPRAQAFSAAELQKDLNDATQRLNDQIARINQQAQSEGKRRQLDDVSRALTEQIRKLSEQTRAQLDSASGDQVRKELESTRLKLDLDQLDKQVQQLIRRQIRLVVAARTAGMVVAIPVQVGDAVKNGQLLAQVDGIQILSPVDGIVTSISAKVGQAVQAGDQLLDISGSR